MPINLICSCGCGKVVSLPTSGDSGVSSLTQAVNAVTNTQANTENFQENLLAQLTALHIDQINGLFVQAARSQAEVNRILMSQQQEEATAASANTVKRRAIVAILMPPASAGAAATVVVVFHSRECLANYLREHGNSTAAGQVARNATQRGRDATTSYPDFNLFTGEAGADAGRLTNIIFWRDKVNNPQAIQRLIGAWKQTATTLPGYRPGSPLVAALEQAFQLAEVVFEEAIEGGGPQADAAILASRPAAAAMRPMPGSHRGSSAFVAVDPAAANRRPEILTALNTIPKALDRMWHQMGHVSARRAGDPAAQPLLDPSLRPGSGEYDTPRNIPVGNAAGGAGLTFHDNPLFVDPQALVRAGAQGAHAIDVGANPGVVGNGQSHSERFYRPTCLDSIRNIGQMLWDWRFPAAVITTIIFLILFLLSEGRGEASCGAEHPLQTSDESIPEGALNCEPNQLLSQVQGLNSIITTTNPWLTNVTAQHVQTQLGAYATALNSELAGQQIEMWRNLIACLNGTHPALVAPIYDGRAFMVTLQAIMTVLMTIIAGGFL